MEADISQNGTNRPNLRFKQFLLVTFVFFSLYFLLIQQPSNDTLKVILKSKIVSETDKKSNRIFCLIKTTPNALKNNKTLTVYRVWASKCANYRFITVIPTELRDPLLYDFKNMSNYLQIKIPYMVLQPEGYPQEVYGKITDKVYSSLRFMYNNLSIYDWYVIADDDAYINMENLQDFLSDKNSSYPVTYGHDFKISVENGYHSGGCGYVISKESFLRIGNKLVTNASFCPNTGIDDVDINSCLRKLKCYINSSLDEFGRERFLPVNLLGYYLGPIPDWLFSYSKNPPVKGENCCSDSLIGIHYMNSREMVRLDNAFKIQTFQKKLLEKEGFQNSRIKFKNLVENYILLGKLESNQK